MRRSIAVGRRRVTCSGFARRGHTAASPRPKRFRVSSAPCRLQSLLPTSTLLDALGRSLHQLLPGVLVPLLRGSASHRDGSQPMSDTAPDCLEASGPASLGVPHARLQLRARANGKSLPHIDGLANAAAEACGSAGDVAHVSGVPLLGRAESLIHGTSSVLCRILPSRRRLCLLALLPAKPRLLRPPSRGSARIRFRDAATALQPRVLCRRAVSRSTFEFRLQGSSGQRAL
mmetsp:Transcript_23408/g.88898  ORF Transcript_23408/g.88898 Transcript_23408/m.88898 type:complete len:231 (-) Transcript_23408:347-1039(-)